MAARLTGRSLQTTLPVRAVVYCLVGNLIAWLVYGAAFQLLVLGILGAATGGYLEYLAAYTISYLVRLSCLLRAGRIRRSRGPHDAGSRRRRAGNSSTGCAHHRRLTRLVDAARSHARLSLLGAPPVAPPFADYRPFGCPDLNQSPRRPALRRRASLWASRR